MKTTVIAIALSFLAAFAVAGWVFRAGTPTEQTSAAATVSFDQGLPLEQRIAALESAVSDERQARQWLQEEVFFLSEELERLTAGDNTRELVPDSVVENAVADTREERRDDYRRRNSPEAQIDRLIAAGFLPSQAEQIVRREAELQMESLQARYEAERSGDPTDWYRNRSSQEDALRQELGDADYERYLLANRRSTTVSVSSVIESSPAHAAGLLPGDEIVRYGGERVFSMNELMQRAVEGVPGENVAVDIMRDGIQMQVVMPRGPFGITGGRRSQ
jgi:C-terminal processing protease CtpA/Prc